MVPKSQKKKKKKKKIADPTPNMAIINVKLYDPWSLVYSFNKASLSLANKFISFSHTSSTHHHYILYIYTTKLHMY